MTKDEKAQKEELSNGQEVSNNRDLKFTHQKLKGLSTTKEEGRLVKKDTLVKGLRIRVYPSGTKTFYLKKRLKPIHNSEEIVHKIGRFPEVGLSDARSKARELLSKIEKGEDPRREQNDSSTFNDLISRYWNEYAEDQLAESTRNEYKRIIDKHLKPEFGNLSPDNITPQKVKGLMDSVSGNAERSKHAAIEDKFKGNRMANCVRKVINSIYSNVDQLQIESPAKQISKLPESGERKNSLSADQIQTFWKGVEKEHPTVEKFFKMLLVLGQRRGETSRMKWEDIEDNKWSIPGEDTKNNEMHIVPLSSLAKKILDELQEINGDQQWVFYSPHNRNDSHINSFSNTTAKIRNRCGFTKEDFRIHDLRTTVTTNLAKLGVKSDTTKRVINHSIPGVTDKHYDAFEYIPQKKQALEKWANELAEIVGIDLDPVRRDETSRIDEEVRTMERRIDELDIENSVSQEVEAQLKTINSQLESSNPSEVIIEECKKQMRSVLQKEHSEEKVNEILSV